MELWKFIIANSRDMTTVICPVFEAPEVEREFELMISLVIWEMAPGLKIKSNNTQHC
jgi:hypothetical protein